jgi:hypothetical protein
MTTDEDKPFLKLTADYYDNEFEGKNTETDDVHYNLIRISGFLEDEGYLNDARRLRITSHFLNARSIKSKYYDVYYGGDL